MYKFKCSECGEIIDEDKVLSAPNPFNASEMLDGCPECRCIFSFHRVCEADGCDEVATCGAATNEGYMCLCDKHLVENR